LEEAQKSWEGLWKGWGTLGKAVEICGRLDNLGENLGEIKMREGILRGEVMGVSERCERRMKVLNGVLLMGGIITGGIGASLIPERVYNNGNTYVGSPQQYLADLRSAQLSSYGFLVCIAGVSVVLFSLLGFVCISFYTNVDFRRNTDVFPEQEDPKPLKSILKDTRESRLKLNIKKWTGNVNPEEIV